MPSQTTSVTRKGAQALLLCIVLSVSQFAYADGVTIITHGYAPQFLGIGSSDNPEWVNQMESAIEARLYEHFSSPRVSVGRIKFNQIGPIYTYDFQWITNHLSDSSSGEILIIVDWADLAGLDEAVPTQTIAENAFAVLPVQAFQLPIHLIGHSRGTSVNTRLCELLGEKGIWVDQFTTLDPHPVDWVPPIPNDETVRVWENVLFADNYWRADGLSPNALDVKEKSGSDNTTKAMIPFTDVDGRPISGSYNRDLGLLDDQTDPDWGYDSEHSDTHLWYHGTIDCAINAFDGAHLIPYEVRYDSDWWTAYENRGQNAGYIYSRIAGKGDDYRLTTNPPIIDGYHGIHGGSGSRYLLDWTNAVWPNVFKFEIEANGTPLRGWGPHQIQIGQPLDLKYEAQDNDNQFTISLFVDADRNPYNGYLVSLDHLTDTHAATGQGWYHPTKTWNAGGFVSAGTDCYVYAKITDGTHTRYFYATPKLRFVAVPTYTISSSAGSHGSVAPEEMLVQQGVDLTVYATPDSGYEADRWYLDGSAVQTGGNSYTVSNVQASHSVFVTFKPVGGGAITVISPQSGATWFSGKSDYIGWEWEGEVGENVKIDLYKGGGFDHPIAIETPNDGTYRWTIPDAQAAGSDYRVRVLSLDGTKAGFSDYFSIEPWVDRSVIEIRTVAELQQVSTGGAYPRNAYYKLMNDIDLAGMDWTPIGSDSAHYFRGTFDGQGHTISGLKIERPIDSFLGLFSILMDSATIKDLNLEYERLYGFGNIGAVAGESAATIDNCHVVVEAGDNIEGNGGSSIGGLVGENTGYIASSSFRGEIQADGDSPNDIGGIVGRNRGTIRWCSVTGKINAWGSGKNGRSVGGIAGTNADGGLIEESYVFVDGRVEGEHRTGGIVGQQSAGTILNCYFDSGGVSGDTEVGGIVGQLDGGIVEDCYVNGSVDGNVNEGALIGENSSMVRNAFWNTARTGSIPPIGNSGGTLENSHGKTDSEMKLQSTYTSLHSTNWNFDDIWAVQNGMDYPKLRGIAPPPRSASVERLSSPAGLAASSDQSDGVHLSWDGVTYDLAGSSHNAVYRVYRSDSTDEGAPKIELGGWQSEQSYVDETAVPEVTYHYWVKAAATSGGARESAFGAPASGMRTVPPLDAPTGVTASDGAPNAILIEWNSVANANFYRVFRSNSVDGTKFALGSWQTGLSSTDTPPNPDTEYHYWIVAAVDDAGGRASDYGGPDPGFYTIPDETAPTINVALTPEAPIETQNVTVSISASDNKMLDRLVLHWDEGTTHSQTWPNINGPSFARSHELGAFSAGQTLVYWAEAWDVAGNRVESARRAIPIRMEAISVPDRPSGPTELLPGTPGIYQTGGSVSSLENPVEYQFNWGDGNFSEWGDGAGVKSWNAEGQYFVKARARSQDNQERASQWSSSLMVTILATPTPTPTPIPTPSPTPTFTPTPTPTPTSTPTPTPTLTPTPTPTPTFTPTPAPTPTPPPMPPVNPFPPDKSPEPQSIDTDISWSDGGGATSYDVYFGEDEQAVANADHDSPLFKGNQSATSYEPGPLDCEASYYWRIDSVNSAGTTKGDEWSFTTEICRLVVTAPNGGERWTRSNTHEIKWRSAPDTPDNVRIELYRDTGEGLIWQTLIAESTPNDGLLEWPIGPDMPLGPGYQVRIVFSDGSWSDISDEPFEIVLINISRPDDEESVVPGETMTVEWCADIFTGGTVYYLQLIEESNNPDNSAEPIPLTDYLWEPREIVCRQAPVQIPLDLPTGRYRIRIVSLWLEQNPPLRPDGQYYVDSDGVLIFKVPNAVEPAQWGQYR